jgi:hypothetical protein
MNCATHNDTAAVAFCRTCGKPLCANCTRDVRGVIYCEPCLAARWKARRPGILAGFFPVGVGAVYCSQYAKGLAYLVIMVLLGWGNGPYR